MKTNHPILPVGAANVRLEIEIEASLALTWKHMTEDILHWWRTDFLVCQDSLGMHLEPEVGGLLFEKGPAEGTGFVWGRVIRFEPPEHFAFTAQIAPPWGGPAHSVVQIDLSRIAGQGKETTLLTLTDSLVGHLTEETLANMDEGWHQLFGEGGLKSFVEPK